MRKYLFIGNALLVAVLVFSALFASLTYSSLEDYDSKAIMADNLESKFIDSASVAELTVPYIGGHSGSGLANVPRDGSSVNVTVSCYDINGDPLYLANVLVLDPVWHFPIYSGFTNSTGVFEAINVTAGMIDVCVSWGNASAPGQPGYYMYLSGIDATSNIDLSVNAQDLRIGGALAKVTLIVQNSTGGAMIDTLLYPAFNTTDSTGFPSGMGSVTDSGGAVTLYLSNDTWAPVPTYYMFLISQMTPSNNTLLLLTDRLVSSDEDVTLTVPILTELARVDLAFSSPSGISLMDDIRLFFEFPQGPQGYLIPPEIHDALAVMYIPSKLHGKMLFVVSLGPGGVLFLPVADEGSTSLCINASMPFAIAALYLNTTNVAGGPWLYVPMKMLEPLPPGSVEQVRMGGSYVKLRSVTPLEAYLGSELRLNANFTDEFYNPLMWIAGDGSTSLSTGFPGLLSDLAVYNITIQYPNGTVWYDGQAIVQDPYQGFSLNGDLSGVPPFPSLDELGTHNYSIFIDAGPWLLDPPGTSVDPLIGSFEVIEPPARATFGLDKNLNVWTEEDTLPSGSHTVHWTDFGIWIHNEDDESDTVLGELEFYIEAENISWVGWEEYADWGPGYANWTFPPEFVIYENEGLGTDFGVERSESCELNLTVSRTMNETTFTSDGYQMANFTASFTNTDFLWTWGNIQAHEHWEVNASIVPGTFQTDAPLEWSHEDMHGIHFGLLKDQLQVGVYYNFSVIVKIELTGNVAPPVLYKPHFGLGCVVHQESMLGGEGYLADMPSEMLPDPVSVAQASTNTSNIWTLERKDNIGGWLGEVSKPVGPRATFSLDENFDVGTEDDALMDGSYQVSPSYHLDIWNEDDDSDTVLGDLRFYAEAENITWAGWEEYADWNSSHVNWTFPPEFVIYENEGFGTDFGVEPPETVQLNLTISRWMNQTTFSSDGYQLVRFEVKYVNTEFLWSWGNIGANERWEVNASIVPGTFQTDAPLDGPPHQDMHWIHFNLRRDLIQPGVYYNFSVIVKVELAAGHTVVYKPYFHIGRGVYQERAVGPDGFIAEMPLEMLPARVTVAHVETNETNHWLLERRDHVGASLHEYVAILYETSIFFNLQPNPAAVGQTLTLKGILVDEYSNPLAGETVKLYARSLAGSWKYITSLTTNEHGIFTWQAKIPVKGTFILAAYYPGSETYESTYNLAILIVQ